MMTRRKITKSLIMLKNNSLIIRNYFSMLMLQVINILYFLVIYPYIITKLGVESYGVFLYGMAISAMFSMFINFGFDLPCLSDLAKADKDNNEKNAMFSSVLYLKFSIWLIGLLTIPVFYFAYPDNFLIILICIVGTLGNVFLFTWYFQGMQNFSALMKIQFYMRLSLFPLVLLFINKQEDLILFAFLNNGLAFLANLVSFVYLIKKYNIKITSPKINNLKKYFKNAVPYFSSSAIATLKFKSVELLIGTGFGMRELAIFDLANKIYSVPSLIVTGINTALFPKVSKIVNSRMIKKIILGEALLSVIILTTVALFGRFAVKFLGNNQLPEAYEMLLILTLNIFPFLIVGSFIYFIMLPIGMDKLILKNQIYASLIYSSALLVGWLYSGGVYVVLWALVVSGFFEIFYCYSKVKFNLRY